MHDLLIIGAGPAVLSAGFQAGLRGVKAIIVDSLPMQGVLLTTFYPYKIKSEHTLASWENIRQALSMPAP
jgi:thioredoxin reductase